MAKNNDTDHHGDKTNDGQSNGKPSHLRWVFIGGGIAIAGLLLASIWWPNLTERTKFFTGNLLNLVIALAVIAQVLIYRKQWEIMQHTVTITERSFRANTRAYIFINDATLESAISSGSYPYPSLVLKNSGTTPAYRYRVRFEQAFLAGEEDQKARQGIMPRMRELSERGHVFGPGEFSTLNPERKRWESDKQRDAAMQGLSTYHMWGLICYIDIFNREHSYPFSLYIRNPTLTRFVYGSYGNDIEIKDED
jgi:hypothetical protein